MGSDKAIDEEAYDAELPQFTCTLIRQPYWISRYPITVAQYQTFVDAGGYKEAHYWTTAGWAWREANGITGPEPYNGVFETINHPQVGVSWYEALAFCAWLSEQVDREIRLPTEPEWERAARHIDGRIYPWGNVGDPAARCNMRNTGIGSTSAVGLFPSSYAVCGAADLAGDVLEWTLSLWGADWENPAFGYPYQAGDGRENPEAPETVRRVLRGGSFYNDRGDVRCAYRLGDGPDDRDDNLGFRVVSPGP
jgi:formylglycine-generating enzyme required for sulfatase activity